MPLNSGILQQIAQGGQSLAPEMMRKGAQLGQQLKLAQQADQDRSALQAIAQAFQQGGSEAAIQTAGQLGQLAPAMRLQQQQDQAERAAQAQAFREQQFGAQQAQRDEDQAFRQQQFGAQQDFRGQQLGLQREALSERRQLAQQKRQEKASAKKRGGKPTVDSAKAAGFFNRLVASDKIIKEPESVEAATNLGQKVVGGIPTVGNFFVTPEFRKFDQAKRDFINGILRRESGAVISDAEFANAEVQYFPQPGDDPGVIAQKEQNRKIAIEGIRRAGLPSLGDEPTQNKQRRLKFNPATGALE